MEARPPRPHATPVLYGEAIAMLARRGLRPSKSGLELPFPEDLERDKIAQLAELLGHYAFRLFLRGAIQKAQGFAPEETTRYLAQGQSRDYAESLVALGLAGRISPDRYRMLWAAKSFGGTLEWYVARELSRRYGFDVATGVRLHASGVGGDIDIVAASEGKLLYLELKSSPPRNLEIQAVLATLWSTMASGVPATVPIR